MKKNEFEKIPQWIYPTTTKFLLDKNLTDFDKTLYVFISTLSAKKGYCFATNNYLAYLCNCSIRNIQLSLNRLKKADYIFIELSSSKRIIRTYASVCADMEEKIKDSNIFHDILENYNWLE